jgi:hypothetical protein
VKAKPKSKDKWDMGKDTDPVVTMKGNPFLVPDDPCGELVQEVAEGADKITRENGLARSLVYILGMAGFTNTFKDKPWELSRTPLLTLGFLEAVSKELTRRYSATLQAVLLFLLDLLDGRLDCFGLLA